MNKKSIHSVDIQQFLSTNQEAWEGDGFFITNDIYPYLQSEPNRIAFYAIALCNGGLYRTDINLRKYSITAGSLMILKPYQTVNMLEIRDYTGMLLIFNKDFFLRSDADLRLLESLFFFKEETLPVVSLAETDARILMDEFIMLRHKAARKEHPYRSEIVRNLVVNFLYEIDAFYRNRYQVSVPLSYKEELIVRFQELLLQRYKTHHDVQFYADTLHISPKYLSELLRESLGKNASELIYESLAREACILLKSTSLTVAQIAAELHFADTSAFNHFFKKHCHCTPLSYRKGIIPTVPEPKVKQ